MPTWGERFGGPLRDDQVDSLVAFVMNWEDRALAEATAAPELPPGEAVGSDIAQTLPAGDETNGKALAEGTLGCAACHTLSTLGPAWAGDATTPGIGAGGGPHRRTRHIGAAASAEQYLLESIVNPNAHLVPGSRRWRCPAPLPPA
jgi:mono/diheme cytochrome c family protein